MTCVAGPGLCLIVTDAARAVLGTVLPALWRVLEAHGGRQGPRSGRMKGRRLRVVADGTGGLVVGLREDFAEAAA